MSDITITEASKEESVTTINSTASNHEVELEVTSDKETTGEQTTLINSTKNEAAITEGKLKSASKEIDQALETATQPQLSHNRHQLKTFDDHLPAIDHDTQTEKGNQQEVDSENTETQNKHNQGSDSEGKDPQTEYTPRLHSTPNTTERFWTLQRKSEGQTKEKNEVRLQRKIDQLETELKLAKESELKAQNELKEATAALYKEQVREAFKEETFQSLINLLESDLKKARENEAKAQSDLKETFIAHYQELTKVTNENQHKILQLSMSESDLKNKLERVRAKAKVMRQKLQVGQRRTRRMLASLQKCSAELELDSYSDNEDTDDSSPPLKPKEKSTRPQPKNLPLTLDAEDNIPTQIKPRPKPLPPAPSLPSQRRREPPTFKQIDDWLTADAQRSSKNSSVPFRGSIE